MIARAAMPPAPPMQRKTIRRAVIAVLTIGAVLGAVLTLRAIGGLALLRRLRLAPGDEGRQPLDVGFVGRRGVLLARLKLLRMRLM
jgi:hypothetical protein